MSNPPDPTHNAERAEQAAKAAKAKPVANFGQQIMIAILVVAVGLLFGMGPVLEALRSPAPGQVFDGISQADVSRHQRTAERLQAIINPNFHRSGENFVINPQEDSYAIELLRARLAEQEGLAPTNSHMREWFSQWQTRLVPGSDSITYGTALAQAAGTRQAVDSAAVLNFLRLRLASEAYSERFITVPVPPVVLGKSLASAFQQRVSVQSVTLDSAQLINDDLLAEIAADDDEVNAAYQDLRTRFYRTPVQRTLSLYIADSAAIAEVVEVDEESLRQRYEATKAERFTITSRDEEGEESTTVQSFEDVVATLREEMTGEVAAEIAALLAGKLRNALIESGLAGKPSVSSDELTPVAVAVSVGPEDDARLQQAVAISVQEGVTIDQPDRGNTRSQLAELGAIDSSDLNLFTDDHGPGYLSAPYRPILSGDERSASHVLILVTGAQAAGYQALDEVRDDVVRWLAARRQYPALYAAASDIAEAARKHEAGLAGVFGDEAIQQQWNVQSPTPNTLRSLEGLQPAAARLGEPLPEQFSAVALGAGQDRIQVLNPSTPSTSDSGAWSERPRLRVVALDDTFVAESSEYETYFMGLQTRNQIFDSIDRQLKTAFNEMLRTQVNSQR